MTRLTSFGLILAFVCASVVPAAAQRSPAIRSSKVGPVASLSSFASVRAYSDGNGVYLEWRMTEETNNLGFQVHRRDGAADEIVSQEMIPGSAFTSGSRGSGGDKYSFFDESGSMGAVYYITTIGMDGRSAASGTTWVEAVSDLSEVGAPGSATLSRQIADSKLNRSPMAERLTLPKELAQEVLNNRPAADASTHAWVVSQPGVRIAIQKEGFYRVTKAQLQSGGFNVDGDPALWQLYRQGVEQSIIVGPNGDYIEFWAKGIDTPETDVATYYLISGPTAGKRIESRVARPFSGTVASKSYSQVVLQKSRTFYSNQILNGDAENYWGNPISTLGDMVFNFTLTGVDFTSENSSLEVKFQGFSIPPADQHIVSAVLNGNTLPTATGNGRNPFAKQYTVPTSYLREGANSIVFRSTGPHVGDTSLLDSVSVAFARKYLANDNKVRFFTYNYRLSKLEGFSSPNVRVFDLTAENAPVLWTNLSVIQEGATYSVRMPSDRGRSMYAVEDSALMQAASITPNNPTNLKVNSLAANLVVITHANWMAQAQTWANYRIGQGFSAKVIDVADIYDEFNFGDYSSLSIRDFLQYAKSNWQTPPTYVLLLGDGSYDPRNYQGYGYNSFIPTHFVTTIFGETGTDDWFTDFNMDGLAEIPIGRISARTPQDVTNAFSKVTAFEASAPTLAARGATFVYDCYDVTNDYDFRQYSISLRNQLPGGTPVTLTGRCDSVTPPATPQSVLIDSLNLGRLYVNFSGHGARGTWTSANPPYFSNTEVPLLTNANNLSIFTMLSCLNGMFFHPRDKGLAEALVDATNGGAVAAWASTGDTTPAEQNTMAVRFYQRTGFGPLERLGDMINDAKTVVAGGSDVRLSWVLIGDPMLKVRTATTGDRPQKR